MPYDPVWHPKSGRWAHAQELEILVPAFQQARIEFEAKLKTEEERRARLGFFGRLFDRIRRRR